MPRSKACEHAHRLAKALERCLRTLGVLPARAIDSLSQRQALFADGPVLLLDATERPYRRAQAAVARAAGYSGKKRATRKNTLIADLARYIHYLGPTSCGATHDYQMLKNELDVNLGLLDLCAWLADLGYLGLPRDYGVGLESLPHRKPRRSKKTPAAALSDAQRADNGAHARRRVKVEHAISGRLFLRPLSTSMYSDTIRSPGCRKRWAIRRCPSRPRPLWPCRRVEARRERI